MTKDLRLPAKVTQLDGEVVIERWRANRTQTSTRAVGGHLYLTNRRIVFAPHILDSVLEGAFWIVALADVRQIDRHKRDLSQILGGSIRDRLEIVRTDGTADLFVVNKLDSVMEKLERCLREIREG